MQTSNLILFDSYSMHHLIQAIKASNAIVAAQISILFHQVVQYGDVIFEMQTGVKSLKREITRALLSRIF